MWLFFWSLLASNLSLQAKYPACFATFVCIKFFILSVFSSSHLFFGKYYYFSSCDNLNFLGVVRNQVSLGYPNRNLHIRTYRGILRMYLWYSKKKGVNVGKFQHKKMCQDHNCVATTGAFGQNVPTFGCRGNMSPTCWQLYQPSISWSKTKMTTTCSAVTGKARGAPPPLIRVTVPYFHSRSSCQCVYSWLLL